MPSGAAEWGEVDVQAYTKYAGFDAERFRRRGVNGLDLVTLDEIAICEGLLVEGISTAQRWWAFHFVAVLPTTPVVPLYPHQAPRFCTLAGLPACAINLHTTTFSSMHRADCYRSLRC